MTSVADVREGLGGDLRPLSRASEEELQRHRLQGHFPFDPRCIVCAQGRSVFQHRRKSASGIEASIEADFAFLSKTGELCETEDEATSIKVLVMCERLSGCVAYVPVWADVAKVRFKILLWLEHFGLTSENSSIILHTDREKAVAELVGRSSKHYAFQVRRSAPQQHRSTGGAERNVRRLKEDLGVLRKDMQAHNVDVRFSEQGLEDSVTYLALMHNHFGKSKETNMTPLEIACNRPLSKPACTMFGATVLAEIPDSIRALAPNCSRSVEAAFVHPGMGTGAVVQGLIVVDGRSEVHRFCARNVRPIVPCAWSLELGQGFLGHVNEGESDLRVDQSAPLRVDDSAQDAEMPPIPLPSQLSPQGERERSSKKVTFEGHVPGQPYVKTPGCIACESGMHGPGMRHSAKCRRIKAEQERQKEAEDEILHHKTTPGSGGRFDEPMVPPEDMEEYTPSEPPKAEEMEIEGQEMSSPRGDVQKGVKRDADVSTEELEKEIRSEPKDIEYLQDLQWSATSMPLCITASHADGSDLTSPDFYVTSMNSIKFEPGKEHVTRIGGGHVLVWKPDEVIDDSTLDNLNVDQGYHGMLEEVRNMESCRAGRLADGFEVQSLKKRYPHARIIPSRWVSAYKSEERVRCRIVAKDLHSGVSARALGISSPTPAAEALRLVLTICANRQFRLRSLDISHAFMHSPLPEGSMIVLKLPQSVSLESGEPAFLILERSLNGLRDASLHWLLLLSSTIKVLGMTSDETEPCLYQGVIRDKKGREIGSSVLLVYVDDILVGSSNQETEEMITKAIAAVVPVKVTGQILPGDEGGGELDFLGRKIYKSPKADQLAMYVSPSYLDSSFAEYDIKKGSQAAPDVAAQLEKTDEASGQRLSPEAYQRFRRCLGRLLWLSQSRQEIKLWLSLIGVKQADPTQSTEAALRAVMRYLLGHRQVSLVFPSPQFPTDHVEKDLLGIHIHGYCDASHGPYRFNMRKSISGEVLTFEQGLIRTAAKQQQPVALSSCEAETYALQAACQSATSLAKLVKRIMVGLGEASDTDQVMTVMLTDSASAQQLIQGIDIPRRSRHIEIRLSWLQNKIAEQQIKLKFVPGVANAADMYTKCLSTTLMSKYVSWLGFEEVCGPTRDLHVLNQAVVSS